MVKIVKEFSDYQWKDDQVQTWNIFYKIKKILDNFKQSDLSHLDVGCGNGALTKKLSQFFKSTYGIDTSKKGINFANIKNNKSNTVFSCESIDDLLEKNRKFQFVTSIEVIEHVYDPFHFIKGLYNITEENGYVLISTPYHGYFKNLLISLLNLNDRHYTVWWPHGHIKFFSIKTLTDLINRYDFKIESINFSGRFYPFSHSMIFLLKKNKKNNKNI